MNSPGITMLEIVLKNIKTIQQIITKKQIYVFSR